jgi:NitT/TauT family transport system permease protein
VSGGRSPTARRGAIASLVLLVVFLSAWEWGPGLLGIPPFIIPPASAVAAEGVRMWNVAHLMFHTGVTFAEVIVGFAIGSLLGAIIGYLLGMSPSAELALSPIFSRCRLRPRSRLRRCSCCGWVHRLPEDPGRRADRVLPGDDQCDDRDTGR